MVIGAGLHALILARCAQHSGASGGSAASRPGVRPAYPATIRNIPAEQQLKYPSVLGPLNPDF